MAKEAPDYSGYAGTIAPVSDDKLAQLSRLATQQQQLEAEYEQAEATMKRIGERLRHVSEVEIPNLMDEVGMQEFTTADGLEIKVGETLRCSISKEKKPEAHKWLEENGSGGIIRNSLIISFPRDEEAWFNKFQRDLARRKRPVESERTSTVAGSTLRKCLEELLEQGVDVPLPLFNAFWQRAAKVKQQKKKG